MRTFIWTTLPLLGGTLIVPSEQADIHFKMAEPNPPVWPETVKIFHATDDHAWIKKELASTQDPWDEANGSFTCGKHFSRERTALLFAPGEYKDIDVEIGYYVQLAGLGASASDVKFVDSKGPYVPALNKHLHRRLSNDKVSGEEKLEPVGTCLDSFWRSAENFSLINADLQWAVSQAAPLRRVRVVGGDLYLHDGSAYASGGHLANAEIDGAIYAGGQQQYLLRNVHLGKGVVGGAWSMVYVGCTGNVPEPTAGNANEAAVTVVENLKIRLEKPYIAMKPDSNKFELHVPQPLLANDPRHTLQPLLDGQHEEIRDFSNVRVARDSDPINSIQQALDEGKDVVLSPGIYKLEKTIEIRRANQVVLGLGLATLEAPLDGSACIHVETGVAGVRIAGIMLEATENTVETKLSSRSLLEWGEEGKKDPGSATNPGALFDLFVRVGGATSGNRSNFAVDVMMHIHSSHVVGDNLWVWRADHAALGDGEEANYPDISPIFWQTEQNEYRAETGIEVAGDDVIMYGLAVEHANGHQTVWSGERGSVHFYQCEFPYDVMRDFAEKNFRGYLVTDNVSEHEVYAPGVYSNFRNDVVFVSTAMEHPDRRGIKVVNPFTVKLDNSGGILSIVNYKGGKADTKGDPVRLYQSLLNGATATK